MFPALYYLAPWCANLFPVSSAATLGLAFKGPRPNLGPSPGRHISVSIVQTTGLFSEASKK